MSEHINQLKICLQRSGVGVEFDDLKVTQTKTSVIQNTSYYPFGLQTVGSWTRENSSNSFLSNGGAELNANSGWYDTFFRGLDPALGRFMQIDPMAPTFASVSPYNYAFNNPVSTNDPTGAYPPSINPFDYGA